MVLGKVVLSLQWGGGGGGGSLDKVSDQGGVVVSRARLSCRGVIWKAVHCPPKGI